MLGDENLLTAGGTGLIIVEASELEQHGELVGSAQAFRFLLGSGYDLFPQNPILSSTEVGHHVGAQFCGDPGQTLKMRRDHQTLDFSLDSVNASTH